jgi:hypothetical protein
MLASDLILQLLVYGVGPLALLFGAFLFGSNMAKKNVELDMRRDQEKKQEEVNKAQVKVNDLELKRHSQVEELRAAKTVEDLLHLWNKGPWGKDKK